MRHVKAIWLALTIIGVLDMAFLGITRLPPLGAGIVAGIAIVAIFVVSYWLTRPGSFHAKLSQFTNNEFGAGPYIRAGFTTEPLQVSRGAFGVVRHR